MLPLLLPDSPVVVWWPGRAPDDPAGDPLGALGTRRITDAASVPTGKARAMLTAVHHLLRPATPTWPGPGSPAGGPCWRPRWTSTRATVTAASVTAERISPSADLLSAWLGDRLRCDVDRGKLATGPGITAVVLTTKQGDITVSRSDGRLATLSSPGQPDRPVALKRRDLDELLSEELRRLDPDDVYAATVKRMVRTGTRDGGRQEDGQEDREVDRREVGRTRKA